MSTEQDDRNLEKQIENTQQELHKLQQQLQERKKQKDRFAVKQNDTYFTIKVKEDGIFEVLKQDDLGNGTINQARRKNFNYFHTEKEAKKIAEYFNIFLKAYHVKNVLNGGEIQLEKIQKWTVNPNVDNGDKRIKTDSWNQNIFTPFILKDSENVSVFIKEMGEDNIYKLFLLDKDKLTQ